MNVIYSEVSSKSQTVIPREVREKLGLLPGDRLRFAMSDKGIMIEKARESNEDDPFATFSEWSSEADEKAYGKL